VSTPDAPPPFAPPAPLPASALRWRCDPATLGFRTTAEVAPADGIVGQTGALEAVRFGLEIAAPGQNVYVRGLTGTGRLTLVRQMLEEIRPTTRPAPDYAYVHDFETPDRPRLLPLPRGRGEEFRDRVGEVLRFIEEELATAIDSDTLKARRGELERETATRSEAITAPLEEDLRKDGLALVLARSSAGARPMVLPLVDGQPAAFDQLAKARTDGKIDDEELARLEARAEAAHPRVEQAFEELAKLHAETRGRMRSLLQEEAERVLRAQLLPIRRDFESPRVAAFLDGIVRDLCTRRLPDLENASEFVGRYEVNLVVTRPIDAPPPIIVENAPSVRTLVGTIDPGLDGESRKHSDHMSIHAGSLLRADGGVLVMEAREVLSQPGAWAALVRTLRTGRLELVPPDVIPVPWMPASLKPEPVEIQVKVVLLGDTSLYYLLDAHDADFPHLFKVLADFDATIPRDREGISIYASVLARLAAEESLPPFDAGAVAALCEHGARIAAEREKLTARFGRLADIAREAAYLAGKAGSAEITAAHVSDAVRRTKRRADGPARRLRELIARGEIRISTSGHVVGQLNGLAVINAGPLTYGFPTRITATVAAGIGGAINIERESQLSGAIHTKAFYILGGLMRHLLPTQFPLTFEASIAFEQSYGGIDGDSASGAEICCLLSALTALPIDQRFAMTGAIDQLGNVLPIGAVNEKIEGYFDTCHASATGGAGVIIPKSNVGDLMLRHDVVDACADGRFCVVPVDHIRDAIALFFGRPAGVIDEHGAYPPESVLGIAMARAELLWQRVASRGK
jgi:predicted ATP-dependent protease